MSRGPRAHVVSPSLAPCRSPLARSRVGVVEKRQWEGGGTTASMSSKSSSSTRFTVRSDLRPRMSALCPSARCGARGRRAHRGGSRALAGCDDVDDAGACGEVDEYVDVTALVVIASSRTSEDLRVRDSVAAQHLACLGAVGSHSAAYRAAERPRGGRRSVLHRANRICGAGTRAAGRHRLRTPVVVHVWGRSGMEIRRADAAASPGCRHQSTQPGRRAAGSTPPEGSPATLLTHRPVSRVCCRGARLGRRVPTRTG